MVFYAQTAIFQLYSGMNMKWMIKWTWNGDEIENGMGHKKKRVNEFRLPLKKGGWVGSGNLASCSGAEAPTPIEYYSSVFMPPP